MNFKGNSFKERVAQNQMCFKIVVSDLQELTLFQVAKNTYVRAFFGFDCCMLAQALRDVSCFQ